MEKVFLLLISNGKNFKCENINLHFGCVGADIVSKDELKEMKQRSSNFNSSYDNYDEHKKKQLESYNKLSQDEKDKLLWHVNNSHKIIICVET